MVTAISALPAAVCTIITRNRLAFARTLFESVRQNAPGLQCVALVIDAAESGAGPGSEAFEVLHLSALRLDGETAMLFQYTPFELCCALKPFVLRYLLEQRGCGQAIYLDSDILVLAPLEGLLRRLESAAVLVTPHIDRPFPADGKKPDDAHLMLSGTFNLGFLGVSRSPAGIAFLEWWQGKLQRGCIEDHFNGIFVDQKYLDMAIGLFESLGVLRDPGCNVAYWNLHSRRVTLSGESWLANGEPLVFYHFSDFDPSRPEVLSGHQSRFDLRDLPELHALFRHYVERLQTNGLKETRALPYGYARYSNGRAIGIASRRAFLLSASSSGVKDPFDRSSHPLGLRLSAAKQWLRWAVTRLAHRFLKN